MARVPPVVVDVSSPVEPSVQTEFTDSMTDLAPEIALRNDSFETAAPDSQSLSESQPVIRSENRDALDQNSSLIFRCLRHVGIFLNHLFGIVSVVFLLAVATNLPIIQLISFGYLLEVSGRLARERKFRDAMVGLRKASRLGGIALGTWLSLMPLRLFSVLWLEAYLVDPVSSQTSGFRIAQIILVAVTVLHVATATLAGGKLRYFFWPLIAPVSFGLRLIKRMVSIRIFKPLLDYSVGWVAPNLVDKILQIKPLADWFVPVILWNRIRQGNLYAYARDQVWDFCVSLKLPYYFMLGLKGFVGTFLWIVMPTTFLVIASYADGGLAIAGGVLGTITAIPVFTILPFMQSHFAKDGKLIRFWEIRKVRHNIKRAPLAHLFAIFVTILLALPLFLLKIEQIPEELLWTLSLVFVIFSWPARLATGWAYRRGVRKEEFSRWWLRWPSAVLMLPVAASFVLVLTLTRYTSWYGAWSLFENHVFLLPAPFWL
ncbi:MAG: hypothetical protein AAF939_15380 [Planctomycetota bacterium]